VDAESDLARATGRGTRQQTEQEPGYCPVNGEVRLGRLKKKAIAEIFKKALVYAKGKSIWMNFDIPDIEKLRNSYLQKTLSVKKIAENLANWHGVRVEFKCYPSRRCPLCGGRLKEFKTKRTRVMRC
jgi:hypothetical protein